MTDLPNVPQNPVDPPPPPPPHETAQAMQAQAQVEQEFLAKNNVVGVGVGFKETNGELTDEVAVVVLVQQKKPLAALSADDAIPKEIDGLRTDVLEVGYLQAQQSPRDRFRPVIPSGVSIGHFKVTAGTLGTMVKDKRTGEVFVLSNNHVLANSNESAIGDAILQPAAMDGGREPGDVVARLERFTALRFTDDPVTTPTPPSPGGGTGGTGGGGCDLVAVIVALFNALAAILGSSKRVQAISSAQAASAQSGGVIVPDSPQMMMPRASAFAAVPENKFDGALARPVDPAMFSDDIRQIGTVNATKAPVLGMKVRKYGRTTEYTEGTINLLNATVDIAYNTSRGTRTARFTGQVIASAMSQGGDSGSLVVDATEQKAVGLLFAGSNLATIFTPIDVVLNGLDIVLG